MPSNALQNWVGSRAAALDEIEAAHRAVGGTGPGRRTATQQINQAYAVMLSSQFQAFSRELHTECAAHLTTPVTDPNLRAMLRNNLVFSRRLDHGNPSPGNLGADFNRFQLEFWPSVDVHRPQNPQRKLQLGELMEWRNAIAHQDFVEIVLKGNRAALQLAQVQAWRRACEGLARSFDEVMRSHIQTLAGIIPW